MRATSLVSTIRPICLGLNISSATAAPNVAGLRAFCSFRTRSGFQSPSPSLRCKFIRNMHQSPPPGNLDLPEIDMVVREMLYQPSVYPRKFVLPSYVPQPVQEIWIESKTDGELHGLYWPAEPGQATIVFFHGNAQSVFEWSVIKHDLQDVNCGLLLVDYPGYGKSDGMPSEAGLYGCGEAAVTWLKETGGVPLNRIVLFGKSLGGPVAAHAAVYAHQQLGSHVLGVVLESTFSCMLSIASFLFPFIPLGFLPYEEQNKVLKSERFETMKSLEALKGQVPLLLIHGSKDEIIPVEETDTLAVIAKRSGGKFDVFKVEGAGHNDVCHTAGRNYGLKVRLWISKLAPKASSEEACGAKSAS